VNVESIDTNKPFTDLNLTRAEERVLRRATGLSQREPRGRLERIFYGPLRLSPDVLITLLIITILVVASFYVAWRFADLVKALSYPVLGIGVSVVAWRRDRLIKKLYQALEDERRRSALMQAPGPEQER
jgi:hypothetical protein